MSEAERQIIRILGTLFALHAIVSKHHATTTRVVEPEWSTYHQAARGAVSYADAVIEALEAQ